MATEMQQQALQNATCNTSLANYGTIIIGFAEKGIPECDIKPRENVFTFNAWVALGRQVKKGEHGIKVTTWIPMSKKDANGEAQPIGRKPRMTTVFHVSQTEPRAGYSEQLWQYALKHGMTVNAQEQSCERKHAAHAQHTVDAEVEFSTEFQPL